MIFSEVRFFAILVGCWLSFFAVPVRARTAVLSAWGVIFYAVYAWPYLPFVVLLAAAALALSGRTSAWLVVVVVGAPLAWFKSGATSSDWLVPGSSPSVASVVIPLGFSFLAFELIHFAVERRRGRVAPEAFWDFWAFVFFFPCRVAGPIKRYAEFTAGVAQAGLSISNVYTGLVRIVWGLFKKFAIADVLAMTLGELTYAATPLHAWKIAIAYGIQLYVDFSAYSDIAIGASQTLGIQVPENFRSPYFSASIRDFWTRWHISLSSWARDYVFTPIGRALFKTRLKRFPGLIAVAAYLATFLVIGAWHGLALNFLLWGLYHGVLLFAHHLYLTRMPAAFFETPFYRSRIMTAATIGFTFLLVTVGWVPFMTDLPQALKLLRIMFAGG